MEVDQTGERGTPWALFVAVSAVERVRVMKYEERHEEKF